MTARIMVASNTAWSLLNFRTGLIRALVSEGYEVVAVAPYDEYAIQLPSIGCRFVDLRMDNQGTHPVRDFLLFLRFFRLLRVEKPEFFLSYTVKPNIYGSMAAHSLGIPVVNNIAGLGAVFIKDGWLKILVVQLYRIALFKSKKVFFQNLDDLNLFVSYKLVRPNAADIVPGSGIDLKKFKPCPLPNGKKLRFLLVARMLWDKGVGEYVHAARMLKAQGVDAEFCLLGFLDVENPAAISSNEMGQWISEGVVSYLGVSDNVVEEIALADCVVLPSYREGTSRALLEAAAMARPIVTTNAVGCREVVDDAVNGYLCEPKNSVDLAEKLAKICSLSPEQRELMGANGRIKVEQKFDEVIVVSKYMNFIKNGEGKSN